MPHSSTDLLDGTEGSLALLPGALPAAIQLVRSIIHREGVGKLSPRSAQILAARLLPPLEPARVVQTISLELDNPTTPAAYDAAMGAIWQAAVVDGKIGLDEARRAMVLTKTRFRARLETAHG